MTAVSNQFYVHYSATFRVKSTKIMLFNFALEYAIRIQVNQDGLKLNGTHHLMAYADDINILEGSKDF